MTSAPDGYTFTLSDDVTRTPVRYKNRYGIDIAAELYKPKDLDESAGHAALLIGPPHGGVKEQGPGVYAQELAKRGFVAIGFDPSHNGESGGEPRHITSPEIFAEDFSAGVDYLGTLGYVDRERIGAVTSAAAHINFGELRHLADIAPRPILLITGDEAHSRYFSEDVHEQATGPKELVVVPGARHIDFYDRTHLIPFDRLDAFFEDHLR